MAIYLSENGDWGDYDSLCFINDDEFTNEDYDTLGTFSWTMLMDYAEDCGMATAEAAQATPSIRPTEWEERREKQRLGELKIVSVTADPNNNNNNEGDKQ